MIRKQKRFSTWLYAALLLGLIAGLMAGCASATPTQADPLKAMQAQPWLWVGFANPVEKFSVENPLNYQIVFNADKSLNIRADCNTALGSYTVDNGSLKIELGPMTLAACPPGSRSNDFVGYLSHAAVYFFKDGHLYIDLFADSGTLEFKPGG